MQKIVDSIVSIRYARTYKAKCISMKSQGVGDGY